jgi:histidinol-phosphate aminotransferase
MSLKLNSSLAALPVYQPGRPIEEVARELGMPAGDIIKLASNENPFGPSPLALAAVEKALKQTHLYPDGNGFYLKQKLAAKLGVLPENLVLGNGSNDIIEFIAHALLDHDSEVIASQYCFAVYPIVTQLFGAKMVTVPAKNFGHDLDAMLRAVTPRTKIMFVANPNNPTGTRASDADIQRLVRDLPRHVLLAMDEAYIEFLSNPLDLIPLVRGPNAPNVLLLRTFSKIYGLAGFRIGYGIGHADLISALEKIRQPFNTNLLAQAAATAALDDEEHVQRTRANNLAGLKFYEESFRQLGLDYVPSVGNFILVKVGDGAGVFAGLQKRGVIVRPMAGYQLPEWIRISVGAPDENARCVTALKVVLGK